MRVITGKARGIQLKTPQGMLTRPTNCGHVVVGVAVAYYSRRDRGIIDLCDVDTLASVASLVEIDCVQNAAA